MDVMDIKNVSCTGLVANFFKTGGEASAKLHVEYDVLAVHAMFRLSFDLVTYLIT